MKKGHKKGQPIAGSRNRKGLYGVTVYLKQDEFDCLNQICTENDCSGSDALRAAFINGYADLILAEDA